MRGIERSEMAAIVRHVAYASASPAPRPRKCHLPTQGEKGASGPYSATFEAFASFSAALGQGNSAECGVE
jgi:hypothetical protein